MSKHRDQSLIEPSSMGYYVPLADLLTGLIFILMVLVAALSITQREDLIAAERAAKDAAGVGRASQVPAPRDPTVDGLRILTQKVSADLDKHGIAHEVDARAGRIFLAHNRAFSGPVDAVINEQGREFARAVAESLRRYLPCVVSVLMERPSQCAAIPAVRLERVQIAVRTEGETAPDAFGARDVVALSAAQALSIFAAVLESQPALAALYDTQGRPVLEFHGSGDSSPSVYPAGVELTFVLERTPQTPGQWQLPPAHTR